MNAPESRARAYVEAFALGLLAAVPILPYLLRLARQPLPRFVVDGDYAGIELATQFVTSGRTLLGPYSRFQFNHPGPAYFFFLKPFHVLCGSMPTGIYVGACALNALAAFVLVFATRAFATRAHAFATTLVVLAWMAAFREVMPHPWNAQVIALPILAFLVLSAFFATGRAAAAPFAMFFAMIATQTHLSSVPAVTVATLGAIVAYVVKMRRSAAPLSRTDRRWLTAAAAVFVVAMLPPIIEQATAREGNLTKLARFFATPPEPSKPIGEALSGVANAAVWLPQRLFGTNDTILLNIPFARSDHATIVAIAWLASIAAGVAIARRRGDVASLALCVVALVATGTTILSMRNIVGPFLSYLLFWTTAVTALGWIGSLSAIMNALGDRLRAGAAVVVLAAVATVLVQGRWLAGHQLGFERAPDPLREVYGSLVERTRTSGATPVLHPDVGWLISLALLDELARDGLDARVEERERWILGRQFRTPTGAANVFHVYTQTANLRLPTASCLERIAVSGDLEIFIAPKEVSSCD